MLTIRKKLEEQAASGSSADGGRGESRRVRRRMSIRSQLLTEEVRELGQILPKTCTVNFPNHDNFRTFIVTIRPEEGYWKGGIFHFNVQVPEDYNNKPPNVSCNTRLWHPNINETGDVCLSILRETSIDGTGWSPARRLKDVILGLNSLFTDLLNFDDPLNLEAAQHYERDKNSFARKVYQFVKLYAS
ncbi:NEDD8-conjugating enzyme UBE2F [Geodia barretti]|uniref:E2 NEDD8-conjugating enzyme n=1 Tax=Geodia barretti TaxID=519541 RepID=A0AA35TVD1_GEOBA|nr:NEDD8-conjugating enzyme UBE2F [Geodia barretti]